MYGVFGTISRLDRERENVRVFGFYSGEYVVVLMIIIMTPKKEKERKIPTYLTNRSMIIPQFE